MCVLLSGVMVASNSPNGRAVKRTLLHYDRHHRCSVTLKQHTESLMGCYDMTCMHCIVCQIHCERRGDEVEMEQEPASSMSRSVNALALQSTTLHLPSASLPD